MTVVALQGVALREASSMKHVAAETHRGGDRRLNRPLTTVVIARPRTNQGLRRPASRRRPDHQGDHAFTQALHNPTAVPPPGRRPSHPADPLTRWRSIWECWRPLTLETRMQVCRTEPSSQRSRPAVATALRRMPLQCEWCAPCGRAGDRAGHGVACCSPVGVGGGVGALMGRSGRQPAGIQSRLLARGVPPHMVTISDQPTSRGASPPSR
jgi:hypothetical protein